MSDNQPRYTTKRLHDEIAKVKEYARREALQEAAGIAYRTCAETRHVTLGEKTREAIMALVDDPARQTKMTGLPSKEQIVEALIDGAVEWKSSITKGTREDVQADHVLALLATTEGQP